VPEPAPGTRAPVGADTGGTFTDVVAADGRSVKVLSTPDDPGRAVATGLAALAALAAAADGRPALLAHGTTVATNALLERRGAEVALVTNEGLADVIEIARQDRPALYDQLASRPAPLVPRHRRYEVPGRLAADGSELAPVDVTALASADLGGAGAVAVCLLHADLDAVHERAVASVLRGRGLDVTCSHEVSPEMREYERTVTTVINATLRPRCRAYLRGLADLADEVLVMTSAGGLMPAPDAAELPAAILLSGPAGGVRAGAAVAIANGFPDAITFDMGGTSTDVCLIVDGAPAPAAERAVGGFTVRFPSLDVHTIGAGGGSIARIDPGGALVVGPQSAGAVPGPASYGRGGTEPTVTDANLVAGRIPPGAAFGPLSLDIAAAAAALDAAGVTAEGVLDVVNANMERALRAVSVERGVDPAGLALVAFGGAGPLHACALADALGMPVVVVPARAGVLSAAGILTAPPRRDLVRSWRTPDDHTGLDQALSALAGEARALAGPGAGRVTVETAVDCRYRGQSHELTVPDVAAFHDAHERHNGYARRDHPVEVVALRAVVTGVPPVEFDDLPAPRWVGAGDAGPERGGRGGEPRIGPAVIAEADCTIWVADGWHADAGAAGAIVLRRTAGRGPGPDAATPPGRRPTGTAGSS
jgi:N-methylhydantoinase A/oxoprolinase/acetone carboxylase beta subunit